MNKDIDFSIAELEKLTKEELISKYLNLLQRFYEIDNILEELNDYD
jgi:methionyl-tRNA synthetase